MPVMDLDGVTAAFISIGVANARSLICRGIGSMSGIRYGTAKKWLSRLKMNIILHILMAGLLNITHTATF